MECGSGSAWGSCVLLLVGRNLVVVTGFDFVGLNGRWELGCSVRCFFWMMCGCDGSFVAFVIPGISDGILDLLVC